MIQQTQEVLKRTLRQVGKTWLVRAVIMAVRDDFLEVRVRGSFFTTNGLANIQKRHAVAA
jgi:hypothetical protein